jgi:hypothetical protein
MKNRDTILKYLSGLMNRDEVIAFEQRLRSDSAFNDEYEKLKIKLNQFSLDKEIEGDSAYFNNLLPKVRTKIDARKSKKAFLFAPGLSFVIALFIIFFLKFPGNSDRLFFDSIFSDQDFTNIILETDDSTLTDYLEIGIIDNSNYLISDSDDDFASIYIDGTILDEMGVNSTEDYYEYNYNEDVDDFSDEEVNIIYNELIDKKIL